MVEVGCMLYVNRFFETRGIENNKFLFFFEGLCIGVGSLGAMGDSGCVDLKDVRFWGKIWGGREGLGCFFGGEGLCFRFCFESFFMYFSSLFGGVVGFCV